MTTSMKYRSSDALDTFANQTTMHGVPKVILARTLAARVFWSLICIGAGVMFCTQVTEIIRRYFSYPMKVTVEMVPIPVPFPAISLCNMRNLDFYYLNLLNRKFIQSHGDPIYHINRSENEFVKEYMKYAARYGTLWNDNMVQSLYSKEFQEVFSRTTLSANIPEEFISTAAIQLEEFVVSCYFGGNPCNMSQEFIRFFDPYYFNCFTYKAPYAIRGDSNQQSLSEGIENGWSAILLTGSGMLDRNEELLVLPGLLESRSPASASDGVRVVIHPPDSKPFPLTEGYDVPPGFSVSLGIRPRRNVRLGPPYGNCTNASTVTGGIDENGHPMKGYRTIYCMKLCLQHQVIASCDCYDASLPRPSGYSNVKPCRRDDFLPDSCMFVATDICLYALLELNKRIQCARKTRDYVTRNMTLIGQCSCHPPCDEVLYDVSYSLSKWPAFGYEGDSAYIDIFYITNFTKRFESTPKFDTVRDYFRDENRSETIKDFARLNVYVADSNVVVSEESPDYDPNQLVSDIGGQLGLWVGISIITITEVLELLCILCHLVLSHQNDTSPAEENADGHTDESTCRSATSDPEDKGKGIDRYDPNLSDLKYELEPLTKTKRRTPPDVAIEGSMRESEVEICKRNGSVMDGQVSWKRPTTHRRGAFSTASDYSITGKTEESDKTERDSSVFSLNSPNRIVPLEFDENS